MSVCSSFPSFLKSILYSSLNIYLDHQNLKTINRYMVSSDTKCSKIKIVDFKTVRILVSSRDLYVHILNQGLSIIDFEHLYQSLNHVLVPKSPLAINPRLNCWWVLNKWMILEKDTEIDITISGRRNEKLRYYRTQTSEVVDGRLKFRIHVP